MLACPPPAQLQFVGVGLVMVGVCLAAWPTGSSGSPLAGVNPVWSLVFVASLFFPAYDTLLKEGVFRRARSELKGQELDL